MIVPPAGQYTLSMPVTLGARAEHGFDQPLGLMSDCHRRIEHFLAVLQHVEAQVGDAGLNDEQRRAVEAALTYFRTAAPRHTHDEEQSLFPLLRASQRPDVRAALQALDDLQRDHAAADAAHAEVDLYYRHWLDRSAALPAEERQKLRAALAALRDLYARHIEVEDRQIFPLAGRVLSEEQLRRVGSEMAARHGLSPGGGASSLPGTDAGAARRP